MIDNNRWIYSTDIAAWLAQNVSLDLEEQMDYICSAPHRTLDEKLDKRYIKNILRDRKPDSRRRMEHDKKRLAYVRGLTTE